MKTTFIAALIVSIIVMLAPHTQAGAGCVVSAGVDIPADLATAQAGARCLELPAGVFTVQPGVLLGTADGLRIFGQGMGRTVLKLPDDLIINSRTYVLRFVGAHQRVSDLTIQGGLNASGTNAMLGISLENGAVGMHVQRVEVVGLFGGNTAGASGIDLAQLWNGPTQRATIEDCIIRDMPNASGIVINAQGNTIRNNTIRDVGNTTARHGIYVQGGYNLIDGNTIERVGGYSLHAWQKVQSVDGSGNIYKNNVSVDPGFQHMIISGMLSNGTNPAIPNGKPLTRNVTIESNLFRNTGGLQRSGMSTDVPAIISGNTFEDVLKAGGSTIAVQAGAAGSVVTGNRLTGTVPANGGGTIQVLGASVITGNIIDNPGTYQPFFGDTRGSVVANNLIR